MIDNTGNRSGNLPDPPSPESAPLGRPTGEVVAEALRAIESRKDRDPRTGRWAAGNTANGRSLARSGALWTALGEAKAELVERLRADLALDGDAPATLDALLDAFAEATLLRRSLFVRLSELGGATTTKGRARALFSSYLSTLDRETRLAQVLGLSRRSRPVPTLAQALAAVEEDGDA